MIKFAKYRYAKEAIKHGQYMYATDLARKRCLIYFQESKNKKRRALVMHPFCIYGAGIVASSVYTALKSTYNCIPTAFLISERNGNPLEIDGIPVKLLSEWNVSDSTMLYLVAVPESHHSVITRSLCQKKIGDGQIVLIDNCMENKMMEDFYARSSLFVTARQILNATKPCIEVFQAKCHVDKPLQNAAAVPDYVCPIQVGTALADQVILDRCDNQGDNISSKNKNYCELTAAYSAWKHSRADYKGLCHYRRIFDISDQQMQELLEKRGEWDVILPYPSVHYPNISRQHSRYVNEADWNAMLQALEETAPEYYKEFDHVFQEQFFYNFNMLIARAEIFDDYCRFLFSVLGRTEELTTPKGWERSDRFAGYLGENLTTLYFRANRDKLKIVHAGKILLV